MIVTNPFSPGSLTRETINTVARGWWVLLLSGIVGVVAGGIILFTDSSPLSVCSSSSGVCSPR